jgi:fructokinase
MHNAPTMLCAGEALTDMINQGGERWVSRVGGSVWNVARALAVLGERTAFAGAISGDRFGDALWTSSEAVDLDLRLMQRVQRSPLLAVVEQGEPPRYFFIGDDSADLHFDPAALPAGWRKELRWAHFGGISLAREPLASTLVGLARELKAQGVAISYDPNYRNLMDERYAPILQQMAALADVIKVSDDDLRGLFPGLAVEHALERLRSFNPAAYCLLTRGGKGASLFLGGQRCDARAQGGDRGHGRRRRRQRGRIAAQPGALPAARIAGAFARRAGGRFRRLPAGGRHAAAVRRHAAIIRTIARRPDMLSRTRTARFLRIALLPMVAQACWPSASHKKTGLSPVFFIMRAVQALRRRLRPSRPTPISARLTLPGSGSAAASNVSLLAKLTKVLLPACLNCTCWPPSQQSSKPEMVRT